MYRLIKKIRQILYRVIIGVIMGIRQVFLKGGVSPQKDEGKAALERVYACPEIDVEAENRLDIKYDIMAVVPAYNAQGWLERCVRSLGDQKTAYSFEVVIVDDGSTDKTGELADRLAAEYNSVWEKEGQNKRIRVIHQENRGFSGARNRGLEVISGRYVLFCDSDDYVLPMAFEKLLEKAFRLKADIVEGGYVTYDETGRIYERFAHMKSGSVSEDLTGYAWGKVFKAEIFEKLKFPLGVWYEDSIIKYAIYPFWERKCVISDLVYGYFRNPVGISSKALGNIKSLDTYYITEYLFDYTAGKGFKPERLKKQALHQLALNLRRTEKLGDEVTKKGFWYMRECYLKHFGKCDVKIPYMYKLLDHTIIKGDFKGFKALCGKRVGL